MTMHDGLASHPREEGGGRCGWVTILIGASYYRQRVMGFSSWLHPCGFYGSSVLLLLP